MKPNPDLAKTESLFWALISAPEGVRPGLDDLVRRGVASNGDLDAMIDAGATMTPADRLDVYANMYFFRLLDCLKEDFPKLLEALGAGRFHNLATDYLLACPSVHPSLRYVGARLPGFLARHGLGRECPILADLARLEWARADLFDAADAAPLTREHLATLPQDEAGDVHLKLVPACTLLTLDHDAPRLWHAMNDRSKTRAALDAAHTAQPGATGAEHGGPTCLHEGAAEAPALPESSPRRTLVRVWRQGFAVFHRPIGDDEAASLEAIRAGDPLGRIAQRLSAGRTERQATDLVGGLLQSWIDDGLLAV
jgi:hypothetical protein